MFHMVGYTLRQERERQNLSISDIEQGTSIRALYIEAIENGEYDKLPGKIYTKGFIKNYAKFLEMDVDAIVKEFATDMAELEDEEAAANAAVVGEENSATEKKIEPEKISKPEKKSVGYSIQEENRRPSSFLIVAAVVLIAAIAGGLWSWLSSSSGDIAAVNPPQQTQPVAPAPTPPADPTPVANANPEPPPSDKFVIQGHFSDRCWILVTVDGEVVQEGVFEGGQNLSWEGKENITFRLGNAGGVEFFRDGKSLGVPGGIGEIAEKTFTRQ